MKKYLIFTVIIVAVFAIGIFLVNSGGKKTFYIENSKSANNIEFGNLQDTLIPSILKAPKNLTEDLAGVLAQGIISKNTKVKAGALLPGPGVNMPDPSQIAQDYIKNGLKTANENILNIAPIQLQISTDNSKDAIATYLAKLQVIIKENLDPKKIDLDAIAAEINTDKDAGLEKLSPVIFAHEAAANQIETIPVPADVKNLVTEEIHLLRITANIFKAMISVETDPLAAMTATQQLNAIVENWQDLQKKFDIFIQKINRT